MSSQDVRLKYGQRGSGPESESPRTGITVTPKDKAEVLVVDEVTVSATVGGAVVVEVEDIGFA